MKIKSRYAGRCRVCHGIYNVGEEVEWERPVKGAPGVTLHVFCAENQSNADYFPDADTFADPDWGDQ